MRILLVTLLLPLLAAHRVPQAVVAYAITLNGDTLKFHDLRPEIQTLSPIHFAAKGVLSQHASELSFSLSSKWVMYHDERGKKRMVKQEELKDLYFKKDHFINSSIRYTGKPHLERIVMQNKSYILTSSYDGGRQSPWSFNIYDKSTGEAVVNGVTHTKTAEQDLGSLDNVITKYFPDCTEALDAIRSKIVNVPGRYAKSYNGKDRDIMFSEVTDYSCE
jgi:hypothetical protein